MNEFREDIITKMKICFVGPASSSHIKKWCKWFSERGHETHVISFIKDSIDGTNVHYIDVGVSIDDNDIKKLKYLLSGKKIKDVLESIKPDIINAHYASSYGVALALSGVKGYYLSVWGSDIYSFPLKSVFHRLLLKYSLKKAKYLLSTSEAMAMEAAKYTDKEFSITPFGVDMELFNPDKRTRGKDDGKLIIGTVKSLSELYGIEYILKAVSLICKRYPEKDIRVRIAGDGPEEEKLKQLARDFLIADKTFFLGRISQKEAASEWANMDIAIIPSVEYESFGVAAVEAQACGTALIISDVDGLKEVTDNGRIGIVVPRKNEEEIAKAIDMLISNPDLRQEISSEGRNFVENRFEMNKCFVDIEGIYYSNLTKV